MYDFILASAVEDSKEIKQELENQMKNVLEDSYKRLFNNIDTSRFKAGMDIKRVLEIIFWVAQGFSNRELDHIKSDPTYRSHIDANALVEEFELYLDMLKDTFYK